MNEINQYNTKKRPIYLLGFKSDLRDDPKTIEFLERTSQQPVTREQVSGRSQFSRNCASNFMYRLKRLPDGLEPRRILNALPNQAKALKRFFKRYFAELYGEIGRKNLRRARSFRKDADCLVDNLSEWSLWVVQVLYITQIHRCDNTTFQAKMLFMSLSLISRALDLWTDI